jgi:imidazolonepropionase
MTSETIKEDPTDRRPTLIGPFSQALTMRGLPRAGALSDQQLEVIHQAGVVISGSSIVAVGPWDDLLTRYSDVEIQRIEKLCEERGLSTARGFTLTPGLVDAHTHLCFAGSRARDYADRLNGVSYEEITARGGGIRETMTHTREADINDLCHENGARLDEHLRRGVTTVEVKSGYGLSIAEELKQLRAIKRMGHGRAQRLISTCLAAHVLPPEYGGVRQTGIQSYLSDIATKLLPQIRAEGLTRRIDAFIEPSAFPVELARPYLAQARAMGFELTVHADQFQRGGAQLAAELGAQSADHLEASIEEDLIALHTAGVSAVALPGASLGLGIPFTPARRALDLGLSLVIASDWNPGSAPMGHLLLQASVLGASERLCGAEIWAGMTSRAAIALGLERVGELNVNWSADLLAFPVEDYREILYHQGMIHPTCVWARGQLI